MKSIFSKNWIRSKQPRKQRKYRYNAPLHIRKKFMSVHLSKELRDKYNRRNIGVIKGDTVKVMRGKFKGKSGKVTKVNYKSLKINVDGVEILKKNGTKVKYPLDPSNLMITSLNLDDKKRIQKLEKLKNE